MKKTPMNDQSQLKIRVPGDLKDSYEKLAKMNQRSLNAQIVHALQEYQSTLQCARTHPHQNSLTESLDVMTKKALHLLDREWSLSGLSKEERSLIQALEHVAHDQKQKIFDCIIHLMQALNPILNVSIQNPMAYHSPVHGGISSTTLHSPLPLHDHIGDHRMVAHANGKEIVLDEI